LVRERSLEDDVDDDDDDDDAAAIAAITAAFVATTTGAIGVVGVSTALVHVGGATKYWEEFSGARNIRMASSSISIRLLRDYHNPVKPLK
jgi:hypothetical protein